MDVELKGLPVPDDEHPGVEVTIIVERNKAHRLIARIEPIGPVEKR